MKKAHVIFKFDGHKLIIATAPDVEADRGFIKFFRNDIADVFHDVELVRHAELHGNGLATSIAELAISKGSNPDLLSLITSDDVDLADVEALDTRSFFNDMEGDYSAVFFTYRPSGESSELATALTVVDFRLNENPDEALVHSIKTLGALKVPTELGLRF